MNTAKIFTNGQSQAVRLPKKFRFHTKKVSISYLGKAVVIQPLPRTWKEVFDEMSLIEDNDFLIEREDLPPQKRENFK
jgi:antitoxin VapB